MICEKHMSAQSLAHCLVDTRHPAPFLPEPNQITQICGAMNVCIRVCVCACVFASTVGGETLPMISKFGDQL